MPLFRSSFPKIFGGTQLPRLGKIDRRKVRRKQKSKQIVKYSRKQSKKGR